jgi:hypothetical protein
MGTREKLQVLERVGEIATLAGMKGQIDDENMRFVMGFGLGEGRSQMVYVKDSSKASDCQIITLFSPCWMQKKRRFKGVSKGMALDLLRRNAGLHFASYGLVEIKDAMMVIASIDHLVDTLDPPEFEMSAFHVAIAADMYERENGQDEF